ncbi:MAG: MarR family winged helix-turn-helix transcriptional regulator [Janthinobacterium lividum]
MKADLMTNCHCLSLRQAARQVTQLYDRHLAPFQLTLNQYSILGQLSVLDATPINELAQKLFVDRTTLTRNLKLLQQAGWVAQAPHPTDGRSQCVSLSAAGRRLLTKAIPAWQAAQAQFEAAFGTLEAAALRQQLHAVAQTTLPT